MTKKRCFYCELPFNQSLILEINDQLWHPECRNQYLRVQKYFQNQKNKQQHSDQKSKGIWALQKKINRRVLKNMLF